MNIHPHKYITKSHKMTSSQFRLVENCIGITGIPCLVFFRISLFVTQLRNFDGHSSFLLVDPLPYLSRKIEGPLLAGYIQGGISVNFHYPRAVARVYLWKLRRLWVTVGKPTQKPSLCVIDSKASAFDLYL